MLREPIPEKVRRFILTSVPSVPFVEALLLFRNDPEAALEASFVARKLYIGEAVAADVIAQLHAARIVQAVAPSHSSLQLRTSLHGCSTRFARTTARISWL